MEEDKIKEQIANSAVQEREISHELETSFLDYAMSVIVARALPDARDGFKPVHRRVLFGAYKLGVTANSQYKKSARLVGDVMGKYHPHGDSAIYETIVRLAQDFSLRYPLIDGHGNFGSIDGDSAAAMRYTEVRMTKLAETMLEDIDKETVDLVDNYDGTEKEPLVLPSVFPNMLANGASGIAVGMATNMPPHNLNEIVAGIKLVAHNPFATIEEIMQVLKGPDFPTAGQIIGNSGIKDYFTTGKGSVTVRAKVEINPLENDKTQLIVKEIPYVVNKQQLIEKITELVKNESIEGISDLRDESNREGIRLIIELKRNVIPEIILNKLFKMTQLQTNFAVNMLALVGTQPRLLNIKDAIQIYLDHQIQVLTRKTKFDLKKAQDRLHILAGLHIASQNVDAIIKIIKKANDDKKLNEELINKFRLTPIQTKAILEMKLRSLTAMEQGKIAKETAQLEAACQEYQSILANHDKQITTILNSLEKIADKFGDARKTEILTDVSGDINDEDLIPKHDIVITMSNRGYLKRLPIEQYHNQRRGGVGVTGLTTHSDDNVNKIVIANTHSDILIFSDFGKVYRLRGHEIPLGSKQAKGIPAINFLPIAKEEKIVTILPVTEYNQETSLLFASVKGIIKRTSLTEYQHINKTGKIALGLKEGDKLFDVRIVNDQAEVYLASNQGKLARFLVKDVRKMGRTASGVRGINLAGNGQIVGFSTSLSGNKILSIGTKAVGKLSETNLYRLTKRGSKGVATLKITAKTGKLVFASAVNGNEDALIMTKNNMIIRFSLKQIHDLGRTTQGVKLMNLENDDQIISVAIFKQNEQEQEDKKN